MSVKSIKSLWPAKGYSYALAVVGLFMVLALAGCTRAAHTPRVQAEVLALASAQPQGTVRVIVQKRSVSDAPERRVAELGGAVIQELLLINGFSAELPAAAIARLAEVPDVRWISLDAPVLSAQTVVEPWPAFITWATELAKEEGYTFSKPKNLTDSGLGPAGTYAISRKSKGIFGGFEAEVTSGHRIVKVEAVIAGYVAQPIARAGLLSPYIDGIKVADVPLAGGSFDGSIGTTNVGLVYVDVTGGRQWHWADFAKNVELVMDFTNLDRHEWIYIDAVGLRVWIEPGVDESGDVLVPNEEPNLALPTERQVNVYNSVLGVEALWSTDHLLQGNRVGVAVVDSGVQKTGDLAHLTGVNVNFNRGFHDSKDRYGHGTFVAAVLAGLGRSSDGLHIGVAPKVQLINVRVSDDKGMATVSDVVAGLEWVFQNKDQYNIRVVNLSLNSSVEASYLTDPLCAAVEFLWLNGIVVVVSAGNNGTATLYPPANDPFVITVGATDDRGTATTADDTVAHFSGYGVTEIGSPKPDVVAPGRNIIAYLPNNRLLKMALDHAPNRVTGDYFRMSGTSISAPMVTGAVALLLQDEPALAPDQVKYRLLATANKQWPGYDPVRAGAGYVDVYAAVYGSSLEYANTGIPISRFLLQNLVFAVLSTTDWNSIDWSAVDWGSVDLSLIDWDAIDWDAIDWDAIDWDSVDWDAIDWNSVNWNSVNWNSVNWNSVNWNSVNWNSVNWNSVNWNSDYWEESGDGEEMEASSADAIPSVRRLFQLLAEGEAAPSSWLYLPAINR